MGGKRLDGGGEKIADFLFKNQLTNAAAVIEIKTPKMPLLNGTPYGSSVYGPSGKLTEAVVQALDQIERLHSDIHRIRSTHPQADLQTHGIRGVVVAGRLPPPDQMRSFELYRASLSGVSVITFDELLAKLKSLRDFLAPKVKASAATS